ncbi:ATP-binding protein [uncultured Pseudacidovorax sp.]|uniref:ATP-binding protein n=1 Tax=uncultured Pseudacidovorax sp. TaxID=679313 RepID=UPI00260106C0|nr:ATP-binding protein [uncultured Pseudacidovorax sp.]
MRQTTAKEVQSWLLSLDQLQQTKECQAPEFFRPFHFVTLALVLKAHRAVRIELAPAIKSYATRMGLWEAVGLAPPARVREGDSVGRFVPIETLRTRDQTHDCAKRVAEITKRTNLSDPARESLNVALAELMDNCFAHAQVKDDLHGLACAQYWPRGNLLQVAIADMGIGIRESFRTADSEEMRDRSVAENCCTLATELHASSKIHHGHAGYGLALARQLVERNGGAIGVYSGREWHHFANSLGEAGVQDVAWNGTLVLAEFDTTKAISTQDVYRTWPPVRGYEDEDFDF